MAKRKLLTDLKPGDRVNCRRAPSTCRCDFGARLSDETIRQNSPAVWREIRSRLTTGKARS